MKKLLISVFFAFSLFSCQQSELEFSCDPGINKFVLENQEELSQMTVQELSSYDIHLQKAIFNSWSYQKKRSAWVDKLQYILIHVTFTELERTHIESLIEHISEDYFLKENLEKNKEMRSQFASQWINYSINKLGWSNQFIAFIIYRLYINQSQFESEVSAIRSITTKSSTNSESGICDCNSSADFCGGTNCHSGGCSISTGCGWMWSTSCDGNCY